jgi:hypothetical protein
MAVAASWPQRAHCRQHPHAPINEATAEDGVCTRLAQADQLQPEAEGQPFSPHPAGVARAPECAPHPWRRSMPARRGGYSQPSGRSMPRHRV